MSNRDLLKSFITAPEEFCSFYEKVFFRAGSLILASGVEEEINNQFRSGCDKDYFVADSAAGLLWRRARRQSGPKYQSDLVGIYKWQYKQYILNLRSKLMLKRAKIIKFSFERGYTKSSEILRHRQEYKKLNLLRDVQISAYDIKSRQCVFKFNPFVLLEERKNYSLTISRVKEGVIKPLPF